MSTSEIHYIYTHIQTAAATGYFSCEPQPLPTLQKLTAILLERPLDTFLRRHALKRFSELPAKELAGLLHAAAKDDAGRAAAEGLLAELAALYPKFGAALKDAGNSDSSTLTTTGDTAESPLVTLRRLAFPDSGLHAAWGKLFSENIHTHRSLRSLDFSSLPPLFSEVQHSLLPNFSNPLAHTVTPGQHAQLDQSGLSGGNLSELAELAELALEKLRQCGIAAGEEQRHLSSLSPVGLLMPWRLNVQVDCGRHSYILTGETNTYGRGVSLPQARVSCRMEMVERSSAYLSVSGGEVTLRAKPMKLRKARLSALLDSGFEALDPNTCYLEAPYKDEELYWLEGERNTQPGGMKGEAGVAPVWVPFQMVSLFPNLDEVDLCSAPGSTGLASGTSMTQGRLAALTEIIERDAEATVLYDKSRCFVLEADETTPVQLRELLDDYARLGINVQFMDMTGDLGVPCYQCFVVGPRGGVHAGYGAGLDGRRAIVSALTETPYPYPAGGASGPRLRNLPLKKYSELPNYSLGEFAHDLRLLEGLLQANGLNPVYVDLTRADLQLPVVRAIVPSLQPSADFDVFSRLSPRIYRDYLRLCAKS